ncbi:hypothetical protein GCM10027566_02940 [Arachidicoccus ginsenosidivorans]
MPEKLTAESIYKYLSAVKWKGQGKGLMLKATKYGNFLLNMAYNFYLTQFNRKPYLCANLVKQITLRILCN